MGHDGAVATHANCFGGIAFPVVTVDPDRSGIDRDHRSSNRRVHLAQVGRYDSRPREEAGSETPPGSG